MGEMASKTYGGGTPTTSNDEFWNGTIPWIQSSDLIEHQVFGVHPRKYITKLAVMNSATKIVPENALAIITRVGVGKLAVMPFSYTTSQDFLSLSELKTDVKFTAYLLYKKLQCELIFVQGTSIKGITKDELLSKIVFVPERKEQEAIGAFFANLDRLITLHQRKLDKTKKLKKAFLNLIFSQKLRFYGFEDKWKKEKLKNVLKISNERNKNNLFSKNDVISVSREAGTVNQIEYQGRYFAGNDISNYKVIKPGDLIYTKSPLKDAPYGIFQEATIIGIVSPLYAVYKSTDRVFAPFVAMLLKNDSNSTQYLSPLVSKGAKNTINISDAGALDGNLFFPKIEEQKKFYLLYTKINKTIIFHQKKLDNLKDLKKVLLRNMLI